MSDSARGLPLLSGPPPPLDSESSNAEIACRKCNKEFNMIFTRSRRCNHCGYSYCHSCSDYQALMPRAGDSTGYDAMHVCGFCVEYLTVTAAGRTQLKAMSLAKLKKYIGAYNIKTDRVVEKDDLIDAILSARGSNGCLPRASESFYRKNSVPNKVIPGRPRGLFSRPGQSSSTNPPPQPPPRPSQNQNRTEFARPDLAPDSPPPPPLRPTQSRPEFARPDLAAPEFPRPDLGPDHPSPPHPHPQSYPQYQPYVPRNPHTHPQQQQQQQQYNPPPQPPPRPHSAYAYPPPPPQQPPPQQFYSPPPGPPPPQHGYAPGYTVYGEYDLYSQGQHAPPVPPQYSRPQPQQQQPPPPPQNYQTRPTPPRPTSTRPTQTTRPPSPPPRPRAASTAPPPNLDQLVTMTPESIGSLSIGALKSILFTNHVNAGQILEKSDLVKKVLGLVEDEKAERQRQRQAEEREEMERVQREEEAREERERAQRIQREREEREATGINEHEDEHNHGGNTSQQDESNIPRAEPTPSSPPRPAVSPPKTTGSAATLERTGLCVVCQDEEANIAIVDCGHMAMCRGCSDLIMASSRECPLCRTRIVTEQRLLRIFKT